MYTYPLTEGLAKDGRSILISILGFNVLAVIGRSSRGDSVDHAIGKGDRLVDPLGKVAIDVICHSNNNRADDLAIMRNVVTTEHGEWCHSGLSSTVESLYNHTKHGGGGSRVLNVVLNLWMLTVEVTIGETITAFGHRHAHNLDGRQLHSVLESRVLPELRVNGEKVGHRPDNAGLDRVGITLHKSLQPILVSEVSEAK